MKTITIEMPTVEGCDVTECTYNVQRNCHARAITVGDQIHAACDTFFFEQTPHTKAVGRTAGVGACKMTRCRYNDDYECGADHIHVGHATGQADCLTYAPV